jgi:hypothetical protein
MILGCSGLEYGKRHAFFLLSFLNQSAPGILTNFCQDRYHTTCALDVALYTSGCTLKSHKWRHQFINRSQVTPVQMKNEDTRSLVETQRNTAYG